MVTCACSEARQRKFATVRDAVFSKNDVFSEEGAELLAHSEKKWMWLYRCRACGALWVEACYSSGHMEIYYLFPAPPTDDPVRWLCEQAAPLSAPL